MVREVAGAPGPRHGNPRLAAAAALCLTCRASTLGVRLQRMVGNHRYQHSDAGVVIDEMPDGLQALARRMRLRAVRSEQAPCSAALVSVLSFLGPPRSGTDTRSCRSALSPLRHRAVLPEPGLLALPALPPGSRQFPGIGRGGDVMTVERIHEEGLVQEWSVSQI
jgi:hypothetical protein